VGAGAPGEGGAVEVAIPGEPLGEPREEALVGAVEAVSLEERVQVARDLAPPALAPPSEPVSVGQCLPTQGVLCSTVVVTPS
jgi:hypothetical protein